MMMAKSVVFKCTTSYLALGVTEDYLSQKNGNQPTTSHVTSAGHRRPWSGYILLTRLSLY
jgi:hypothetical protein